MTQIPNLKQVGSLPGFTIQTTRPPLSTEHCSIIPKVSFESIAFFRLDLEKIRRRFIALTHGTRFKVVQGYSHTTTEPLGLNRRAQDHTRLRQSNIEQVYLNSVLAKHTGNFGSKVNLIQATGGLVKGQANA